MGKRPDKQNAFQEVCKYRQRGWLQDGPCKGKIAAIVDVIDQNRVLIDGPCSEVPRQEYPIKNLHLTALKAKFPFSARSRVVSKAWKSEDISGKWAASSWAS